MPSSQILVRLPQTTFKRRQLKDKITIHFQKSDVSNDFEVDDVNIILENDDGIWMTVAFSEPAGVEFVLSREKHHELSIDGVVIPLEVKRHLPVPSWRLVSPSADSDSEPETFIGLDRNKQTSEAKAGEFAADGSASFAGHQGDLPHCQSNLAQCSEEQRSSEHSGVEKVNIIYPLLEKEPDWWPTKAADEEAEENPKADLDVEDDEQLIEVTGFKRSTDDEVLKLYFETPRKSGGGEIETMERDPKTSAVRITFKNPSVAAAVEARKHKLSGAFLKVKLLTKKKRRPLPVKARCLFLERIPDGCSPEYVKLFIENRVSMDEEPTIQYGEKPGTALCTFSRDIPDLDAVVTNISKKKLQGVEIRAEKFHEADAILVTGFSRDVSLEMIELYFDNKKKSGGSRVTDVQPGPMDGQAVVYFEDWKVVNEVLGKDTHRIGGRAVRVQMYHECLGKLSPGDNALISNIPYKPSPELLKRGKDAVGLQGAEAQEAVQKVGMKKQVDRRVQVPFHAQREVKDVDTREKFQGNVEEEYERLIEVTGCKRSTGDEVLRLYFENRRKSGGGEIETLERDSKTGAVRITFKNPSVAAAVEKRWHKLLGALLKVKLITKKKRRPLPVKPQSLFLKGIPDGCSSEHVKLFIENRVSMDEEPTIQNGEKPGTALCTFSRDIPDVDAVITNVSKKKLQGVVLTAEKVRESDAVLVKAFSRDVSLEIIELYFDNKKKSGGSGVREVQPGAMDGQAIVYFEDWKVVNEVLRRDTHMIGGRAVRVQMYHECLGKLSHGDNAFISNIPDKSSPELLKRGKEADSIQGAETQETVQKVGMKTQADRRVQVPFQAQRNVKDVDTREMFQGNLGEDYEQLIEVTGFTRSTDDEVLKLYFENPRKSGGGEIETTERDSKTGAVRITFRNPSDAAVVQRRKHNLSGAFLKVKLITKKKRRPLPINARCLFLKGIPDGCSSEHVKLFIENRVSMDEEPTIQFGEKPGTAICTFSRDIPDLDAVVTKVSKKKLQGVKITAEKVHESDAVLIQGFSQAIDVEMIELYFDNPKKSGGSGVTDVQPEPMDGQAIVYFEDWSVVENVLKKGPHKLGGTELLVNSYHDFLGRLSQFDVPTPHIPKPVSVQVEEPIMEFLYGKGGNIKKLVEELTKVKASLQWPDGSQKSQAKLEPVIDDSQRQSSWLNWNKEAVDVLTDFMKGYKTARVPVPQSLWEDAADTLKKMTTTCSMVPDAQHYAVILVGEQQYVDVAEAEINDIIKKLQKEAEYDAEQAKEDIQWDAEKLQLFTLCGIKQEIEKSFPALKITVFSSNGKTGITLDGTRKTLKEVELQLRRMMDSLEKTESKAGSIKVRFVQHAPDKIHEVLGSQNIRAACSGSDDGKITIYGATRRDVRDAKAYIDNEIEEDVITIKGQSALAVIQGHDGKKLLDCINKQKLVVAYVNQDSIELSGFKSKLEEAKSDIIRFFKNTSISKEYIPCDAGDIKTIKRLWNEELAFAEMENQADHVKIDLHAEGSKTGFIIEGNQEGIESARKICRLLMGRIPRSDRPLRRSLDTRLDSAQDMQETTPRNDVPRLAIHMQETTPRNDVPRLAIQQQDNSNNQQVRVGTKKKLHQSSPTLRQNSSTDETDTNIVPSGSSQRVGILNRLLRPQSSLSDVKFVTNGLTIIVRNGDITKQQVHAIVSPSNRDLKHGGGAAKAIEMAAGPKLSSFFAGVRTSRSNQPLQVSECIVSLGYNLGCQNIIHAVGHIERMSLQQVKSTLSQTFHNCLLKANESQAQSLAMPLIGSGAVGVPKEECADLLIHALVSFSSTPNRFLDKVYLVNIDREATEALVQSCRDNI